MENLFSYLIKSLLTEKSSEVNVKFINTENEIFFNIQIPHSLRSNLIGRDGKILNALKDYIRTVSRKFGSKKVFIKVNEV